MSAKKFKKLRKLIAQRYKNPALAEFVYKQAKKEMKLESR